MKTSLFVRSIKTRASASAKRNLDVSRTVIRIVLAAAMLASSALLAGTPPSRQHRAQSIIAGRSR